MKREKVARLEYLNDLIIRKFVKMAKVTKIYTFIDDYL